MAGFFASLQANRSTATATATELRIYGDKYKPANLRPVSATVGNRKVLAARVNTREVVNPQGIPRVTKEAWVFVTELDGSPSTSHGYLRITGDGPVNALQPGQWLDPNSVEVADMYQGGRKLNGIYLQKATPIEQSAVDPQFIAYCEAHGIPLE